MHSPVSFTPGTHLPHVCARAQVKTFRDEQPDLVAEAERATKYKAKTKALEKEVARQRGLRKKERDAIRRYKETRAADSQRLVRQKVHSPPWREDSAALRGGVA